MSILDKSRRHTGRIIKPGNQDVIELGNRSKLFAMDDDYVKGFGTVTMPGFLLSRSGGGMGQGTSWATWNESFDTGWIGMTLVNLCLLDKPDAADDEDSVGLVTGADLVYTASANGPAGAVLSGGYYSRLFDGIDDNLSITQPLADTLKQRNVWLVIMKFQSYTGQLGAQLLRLYTATNTIMIEDTAGDRKIRFYVTADSANRLDATTTDAAPASTPFWVWVGGDGTYTFGGWSITRPLVHTSITAGQRVQATAFAQFSATGFPDGSRVMSKYDGAASHAAGALQYILFSQSGLISYS